MKVKFDGKKLSFKEELELDDFKSRVKELKSSFTDEFEFEIEIENDTLVIYNEDGSWEKEIESGKEGNIAFNLFKKALIDSELLDEDDYEDKEDDYDSYDDEDYSYDDYE